MSSSTLAGTTILGIVAMRLVNFCSSRKDLYCIAALFARLSIGLGTV
jgi:hypothetical protein